MRRALAAAVLSAVALGGVAGCTTDSPSTPTPSASADETKEVCAEAQAAGTKGSADVLAKVDEITKPAPGQGGPIAQSQLLTIVDGWKSTLSELSQRPAKPTVTAVLGETVAYLDGVQVNGLSTDDVRAKLTELQGNLTTACA
jgi:hypothetical protein